MFTDCLVHFSVLGEFEQFYGHKVHESVDSKKKKRFGSHERPRKATKKKREDFSTAVKK